MKLTILERMKLLEALPEKSDILTIKILRKLRETLSFSEEELKAFGTRLGYACPYRGEADGKREACENKGFFAEQPTCGKHDLLMVATGQTNVFIPPESVNIEKEIHLGTKAREIASTALKRLNDQKQLTEEHVSLYEKFFPPEEEDAVQDSKA